MTEFKNEFRWSVSKQQTFDTCKRQYYYRYYGMWNGWRRDASEEARTCYRLSKMQTLPMLAGTVVHELVEMLLKGVQAQRTLPALVELQEEGRDRLNVAWQQSENQRWLQDPKRNANLFEHYYDKEVADERKAEIRARVFDSLTNFYHSPTFARIRQIPNESWRSIEDFQKFEIDGVPLSLVMDLAIDIDGALEIYDWKTGGVAESNEQQLITYAICAEQEWGYDLDRIRLNLFYLTENHLAPPSRVSPAQREEAITAIRHQCELMQSLLVDPINNVAQKGDFVMTDDRRRCEWCFFQELCYGGPPGQLVLSI